ncbi:hypothetical protein HWV62_34042, partial [Athelia sp. TMB]
ETIELSDAGPRLQELVVRHQGVATHLNYTALFIWIRSLIVDTPSPLQSLHIIADDGRLCATTEPLLGLIASSNLDKLDTLRMPHIMLAKDELVRVFQIRKLRELEFYLWDHHSIDSCIQHPDPISLAPNLSVLRWTTGLGRRINKEKVTKLIEALGHIPGIMRGPLRKSLKGEWRVRLPFSSLRKGTEIA